MERNRIGAMRDRSPGEGPGIAPTLGGVAHLVFLCTGNAARSVMGGAVLAALRPDVQVTTAGTHVIDGQPMSWRTRDALAAVGHASPSHRSQQVLASSLGDADLVVGLAIDHVAWIRRNHPDVAAKTGTLRRLVRDLPVGGVTSDGISALGLGAVELGGWEDVEDPAGHEIDVYKACAADIAHLVADLASRIPSDLADVVAHHSARAGFNRDAEI